MLAAKDLETKAKRARRRGREPTATELERGRTMLELYQQGESLQCIGNRFSLSRQRVYSILKKMPGYTPIPMVKRKERRAERLRPLEAKARELLRLKGSSNKTVAAALGIKVSELEFLRKIAGIRNLGPRIGPQRKGEKINNWKILGRNPEDPSLLDCECLLCGTQKPVCEKNIDNGLSRSCGCRRGGYKRKKDDAVELQG